MDATLVVIGAGVVGLACARALQRAGRRVCIVDPAEPGSACSYGNAGVIATDHLLPLSRPGTLARLPRMLFDPESPLRLAPSRLVELMPWFARFLWACRPTQVRRGILATAALTGAALAAWREELAHSGASDLLRETGMYEVFETAPDFAAAVRGRAVAESFGVPVEPVEAADLRRREPALRTDLAGALYYPGVAHVLDPLRVSRALARAFLDAGGTIARTRATALRGRADGVTVETAGGALHASHAVIAAGIDARELCRTLGFDPPLIAEMGYHVAIPGAQSRLGAPIASATGGFIVTPMVDHLRIAGTVEFARRPAPPDWRRAEVLARRAARLFRAPFDEVERSRWRGCRPTLPDFLPAIGPLPGQPRVIAAFGHQHIGLTTAAVTGATVRDLVLGVRGVIDAEPYAPGRFGRAVR
jgi:glycine/D-amino acid oxidase-like deaminating enzyme